MGKKTIYFKTIFMYLSTIAFVCMMTACAGFYSPKNFLPAPNAIADDKIQLFSSSIRVDRLDPKLIYQQAYYFLENKKFKVAAALLQDLVTLEPENVQAYNALGVAYDYLGDYNRAIESYQEALRLDPQLDYVYNNMGYSHVMQNDYDAALKAFKKAIELDTNHPKYHNNLALSYAKKGNYKLAFSEFCEGGGALRAHYNLAKIYYSKGQYEKAQQHFARVLKIDSTDQKSQNGSMASSALANISKNSKPALNSYQPENFEHRVNPNHNKIIMPAAEHSKPKVFHVVPTYPNVFQKHAKSALIEISNGNGTEGMAQRVKNFLTTSGYQNICVSNANHFGHLQTVIFYEKDYLQTAYQIAKQIPGMQNMKKIEATNRQHGIKIKILLGKDMIAYDKYFTSKLEVAKM